MRASLISVVGIAVAYGAGVVAFAGVASARAPQMVLSLYGSHSEALQEWAEISVNGDEEDRAQAQRFAEMALQRSPLNASAARTLAVLHSTDSDQTAALRFARYADRISRRDFVTQLLLIEAAVRRDDVAGALHRYDVAMRTSQRAMRVLLPILARATDHKRVAEELIAVLDARPAWREAFLWELVDDRTHSHNMVPLITRFADIETQEGEGIVKTLLSRLSGEGSYREAFSAYQAITRTSGESLIDGNFATQPRLPPIEWQYSSAYDLSAIPERSAEDESGQLLSLRSLDGQGGEVAAQMLALPPGPFVLRARAKGMAGAVSSQPAMALRCNSRTGQQIASFRFPKEEQGAATIGGKLVVPAADCPIQWLSITIPASFEGGEREAWISSMTLVSPGSAAKR